MPCTNSDRPLSVVRISILPEASQVGYWYRVVPDRLSGFCATSERPRWSKTNYIVLQEFCLLLICICFYRWENSKSNSMSTCSSYLFMDQTMGFPLVMDKLHSGRRTSRDVLTWWLSRQTFRTWTGKNEDWTKDSWKNKRIWGFEPPCARYIPGRARGAACCWRDRSQRPEWVAWKRHGLWTEMLSFQHQYIYIYISDN